METFRASARTGQMQPYQLSHGSRHCRNLVIIHIYTFRFYMYTYIEPGNQTPCHQPDAHACKSLQSSHDVPAACKLVWDPELGSIPQVSPV